MTVPQERFYSKYDEETGRLIIEVTSKVAFSIMKNMREQFPIEMFYMDLETVDVKSSSGIEYKNVRRYSFPLSQEKADILFSVFQRMYTESIKSTIVNSDN